MRESSIIEIDGTFLGAAILEADYTKSRFYAAHESVRPLHQHIFDNIDELRRMATVGFRRRAKS